MKNKLKFTNVKVGIAPLGWSNDDLPELGKENNFEQTISEMALAGYQGTEIGNKYPKDPKTLHKALKLRDIVVASAWFSSYLIDESIERNLERFKKHTDFLHAMNAKVIVVSEQSKGIQQTEKAIFQDKPTFDDNEFEILAKGLETLGKYAKSLNMILVYHHHMGTGIQTEAETDKLLAMTDPNLVSLIFDTGHFTYSGEDINKLIKKYITRVKHIHLKDIRKNIVQKVKDEKLSFLTGVKMGTFTVPGDGDIDYDQFLSIIHKNNYKGWILVEAEQDPSIANPLKYAQKAMRYLKNKIEW